MVHVETAQYPMIAVITNGEWKPGDTDSNASVLKQLDNMIVPSIMKEVFGEGDQHVTALVHDSAVWNVSRDREYIDQVHYIHDCAECRGFRDQAVQYMLTHADSWLAISIVTYHAVIRDE